MNFDKESKSDKKNFGAPKYTSVAQFKATVGWQGVGKGSWGRGRGSEFLDKESKSEKKNIFLGWGRGPGEVKCIFRLRIQIRKKRL